MAYEIGKLVKADDSLNYVMAKVLNIKTEEKKEKKTTVPRNSMMEIPQISDAGSYEYNSYFKIVDISETGTDGTVIRKFAVKDGAEREYNRCKVNNKRFDIPDYTSETVTQTVLIVLRFSSAENDVTIQVRKELELPDDTAEYSWYQIGMFIIDGNNVKVQQDHLTGVAQMFWYDICGD